MPRLTSREARKRVCPWTGGSPHESYECVADKCMAWVDCGDGYGCCALIPQSKLSHMTDTICAKGAHDAK